MISSSSMAQIPLKHYCLCLRITCDVGFRTVSCEASSNDTPIPLWKGLWKEVFFYECSTKQQMNSCPFVHLRVMEKRISRLYATDSSWAVTLCHRFLLSINCCVTQDLYSSLWSKKQLHLIPLWAGLSKEYISYENSIINRSKIEYVCWSGPLLLFIWGQWKREIFFSIAYIYAF
jgi:hypothetical protein